MASIAFWGFNGSENPTKAVFPFLLAVAAKDAGHQPEIHLAGDAVVLMKDAVINSVVPVGWPALKDLFRRTLEQGIPLYI